MAADADAGALGPVDHDRGVPAHVCAVAALHLFVARVLGLLVGGNRVDVVRGVDHRDADALRARPLQDVLDHELGPFGAPLCHERVEGLDPLGGLLRVAVHGGPGAAEELLDRL
ncbi:hypothetical protein GCM10007172_17190 [Sinomonas atrocyanea]|nr:hypothetical protein GCM10007172_17190 [Sinomonas atrocyanea]